jgi:C-terminal peptidase prc
MRLQRLTNQTLHIVMLIALIATAVLTTAPRTFAQGDGPKKVSGQFRIGYPGYESFKLTVGLTDASGLFGADPVYIAPKDEQMLGTYTGNAAGGSYSVDLPVSPKGRPFDVTGNGTPSPDVLVFDIRLLSDVGERGYMVPNEDALASSLKIAVDALVQGGTLLVWAANDQQQFPTDFGADKKLFTADDPRAPLAAGWSLVNLDSAPFKVTRDAETKLDLTTTGAGDVVDYANLSCDQLIPTFLDRVQRTYPFTELHKVDWDALRTKLIPASKTAQTPADCQKLIRDFANSIPDGHVNYRLPALADERAGAIGARLSALTDGSIVVTLLREGGPAANAGMKFGAVITEWDGKPILEAIKSVVLQSSNAGSPHALLDVQLRDLVRGPLGSKVSVTFQNPGEAPKTAEITRVEPQPATGPRTDPPQLTNDVMPSGVGYIRINAFDELETLHKFDETVTRLIEAKVPAIIIDVRSNPGGLSQMSDAMASRFFDKSFTVGTLISLDGRMVYKDVVEPRQPLFNGCVAVLVDQFSASSADIFAYTFKSQQRGKIVGNTPSYGASGTVSGGFYNLPDGVFIQVPTGGFFNDDKKLVVEGEGVEPDVKVPLTVESLLSPADEVLDAAVQAVGQCKQ